MQFVAFTIPLQGLLLQPDDDGSPRHQIGTTICRHFNDIECKCRIVHHSHNDQPHQILCSDGDQEQMWHDEVKNHLQRTRSPQKVKKQHIDQILTKRAPTELDSNSHSPEFDITAIWATTAVKLGNATAAASGKEIQEHIQTLGPDSTKPEE